MEIRRIGENQIRCALTEAEIQEMGFEINDIISNSEVTQKFMHVILRIVEEQEDIDLDNVSPMVRAELLQDHSMAITFGGESDLSFSGLVNAVNRLLGQMNPQSIEKFALMSHEEKQAAVDQFLAEMKSKHSPSFDEPKRQAKKKQTMTCALRFDTMETMIQMSKVCFSEKLPISSLYKMEDCYYLLLNFYGFSKEEMRSFTFAAAEYDNGHFWEDARMAYVKEHGSCIVKNEAIQMLMAL